MRRISPLTACVAALPFGSASGLCLSRDRRCRRRRPRPKRPRKPKPAPLQLATPAPVTADRSADKGGVKVFGFSHPAQARFRARASLRPGRASGAAAAGGPPSTTTRTSPCSARSSATSRSDGARASISAVRSHQFVHACAADRPMIMRSRAASVHLLTASGAVPSRCLRWIAAARGDWQMMFVWLGIALVVDAVDGPLARRVDVKTVLPRSSGERLDLIVDYLTYDCRSSLRLEPVRSLARAVPPAGRASPSCCRACSMSPTSRARRRRAISSASRRSGTSSCSICSRSRRRPTSRSPSSRLSSRSPSCRSFACIRFRVARLRPLTCSSRWLWIGAAAVAVAHPFPSPLWVQALLIVTAAYFARHRLRPRARSSR